MEILDGLRPFTNYNCTLHAVTVSDGPLSGPITVTTAEQGSQVTSVHMYLITQLFLVVPSAPVVKDITAIDSGSVRIEWNMPTDANGELTIYTITYTIENGPGRRLIVPFNGKNVSYSYV